MDEPCLKQMGDVKNAHPYNMLNKWKSNEDKTFIHSV